MTNRRLASRSAFAAAVVLSPGLYLFCRGGGSAARRREAAADGRPPRSPRARSSIWKGRPPRPRLCSRKLSTRAATPAAKANAQRAMAMSYAFDGDCKNTGKYEQMVIDYWMTQEKEQPANAFYQEGEMANEAARVCIDAAISTRPSAGTRRATSWAEGAEHLAAGRKDSGSSAPSMRWRAWPRVAAIRPRRRSMSPPRKPSSTDMQDGGRQRSTTAAGLLPVPHRLCRAVHGRLPDRARRPPDRRTPTTPSSSA